jgi:8-oxo-dGTP pyrophosphatase MutT (NUDIX family)
MADTIESAGVFCINAANGSVMLGLTKESELRWDWLGGKYEPRDSKDKTDTDLIARETLSREMLEEASLEASNFINKYVSECVKIFNPKLSKYIYVYSALIEDIDTLDDILSRPRIGSPHMGYHWIPRDQLLTLIATGERNGFKLRGFLKILFANPDVRKLLGIEKPARVLGVDNV